MDTELLVLKLVFYVCAAVVLGVAMGVVLECAINFIESWKGARRANKRLHRH